MKLIEFVNPILSSSKIDKTQKKIFEVALLQPVSKNGRIYSEKALNSAVGLLENAKVFANHDFDNQIQNYLGRVKGVYRDGKVIRAKEFVMMASTHDYVFEIAEKDSNAFGFSIVAEGVLNKNNPKFVDEITQIYSVDIVSHPATNKGLFEETKTMEIADLTLTMLREQRKDLFDLIVADAISPMNKSIEELNKKLNESLAEKSKLQLTASIDKLIADAKVTFSDDALKAIRESVSVEQATSLVKAFSEAFKQTPKSSNSTRGKTDTEDKIDDKSLLAALVGHC